MVKTYREFLELLENASGNGEATRNYYKALEEAGNEVLQILRNEESTVDVAFEHIRDVTMLVTKIDPSLVKKCHSIVAEIARKYNVSIPYLFSQEPYWNKEFHLLEVIEAANGANHSQDSITVMNKPNSQYSITDKPNSQYDLLQHGKVIVPNVTWLNLGQLIKELEKKRIIYSEEKKSYFGAKKIGLL
jgi:hypothetical protein